MHQQPGITTVRGLESSILFDWNVHLPGTDVQLHLVLTNSVIPESGRTWQRFYAKSGRGAERSDHGRSGGGNGHRQRFHPPPPPRPLRPAPWIPSSSFSEDARLVVGGQPLLSLHRNPSYLPSPFARGHPRADSTPRSPASHGPDSEAPASRIRISSARRDDPNPESPCVGQIHLLSRSQNMSIFEPFPDGPPGHRSGRDPFHPGSMEMGRTADPRNSDGCGCTPGAGGQRRLQPPRFPDVCSPSPASSIKRVSRHAVTGSASMMLRAAWSTVARRRVNAPHRMTESRIDTASGGLAFRERQMRAQTMNAWSSASSAEHTRWRERCWRLFLPVPTSAERETERKQEF